jgi:hypothetical protein
MSISIWRKIDLFLRNRPIPTPEAIARTVPWDPDFLYDNPDPWYTSAYWAVRRGIRHVYEFPSDAYYNVKWFFQRGIRGWANRDTWGLDDYLSGFLPNALRYLKEHKHGTPKHGTPMSVFPDGPEFIAEDGNPTDEAYKIAVARWDEIMDKMIAGFEANNRLGDGLYEKEVGPYPLYRPVGVSPEAWKRVKDDHFNALRALEARDQAILEEGLALFAKHFQSLWD